MIVDFVVTGSERPRRSMMGSKKRALRLAANHPICERFPTTPDDEAMRLGAGSESNATQSGLSQVGGSLLLLIVVEGCRRRTKKS